MSLLLIQIYSDLFDKNIEIESFNSKTDLMMENIPLIGVNQNQLPTRINNNIISSVQKN